MQDSGFMSLKMNRSFIDPSLVETKDIGELCRIPAPSINHQLIVQNILLCLQTTLQNKFIVLQKPTDLFIHLREVRQPDIMVIAKNRTEIIKPHGVVAPPNIVIEVQSKTSESLDRIVKFKNYATFGIPTYWIIDEINETIEVFHLQKTHYILVEKLTRKNEFVLLENKKIPLHSIFTTAL